MENGKCAVFSFGVGGAYHDYQFTASKDDDGMLELSELKFFTLSGEKKTLYTICSASDWNVFVHNVDSGAWSYKDVTVKLAADIRISRPVGNSEHPFKGTFDGCGHTLTLNITGTDASGAAAFRYISGATIKNARTEGTVNGNMHCSGLVGIATGERNVIMNCEVAANVICTGSGHTHCGGVLGHGTTSCTKISNCLFSGTISGSTVATGIIYGWGDIDGSHEIEGCVSAGTYTDCGGLQLLRTNNGYSSRITNCYRRTIGGEQGYDAGGMADDVLLSALGDGWKSEDGGVVPKMDTAVVQPVVSPVLENVNVSAALVPVELNGVDFVGNTSPVYFSHDDRRAVLIGFDGTLGSPTGAPLSSCRAYLRLKGLGESGETLHYVLNLGDRSVTGDISIPPASDYEIWSGTNGLGAWDDSDASGIHNVFRYAFGVPTGAITNPPLLSITFDASGNPVIHTPPLNPAATGFDISIVASDTLTGTAGGTTYPLDPTGSTTIPQNGNSMRFFRLRALPHIEVVVPTDDGT